MSLFLLQSEQNGFVFEINLFYERGTKRSEEVLISVREYKENVLIIRKILRTNGEIIKNDVFGNCLGFIPRRDVQ